MAAVLGFSAAIAGAQPVAQQAGRQQPAAVSQADVRKAHMDMRKKHMDSVTEMQKKNQEELKTLKAGLKGKPEIKEAIAAKRKENAEAMKALRDSNKAEMDQFMSDHPGLAARKARVKTMRKAARPVEPARTAP